MSFLSSFSFYGLKVSSVLIVVTDDIAHIKDLFWNIVPRIFTKRIRSQIL